MNRIFKILILVVLIPLYWGIEVGCTGTDGGGTPLGQALNGASPDGSIQNPENRPSGQPTQPVVPRPINEFFMALKVRTADTELTSQCSQFAAKSWQDPKTYGVLYALKKTTGTTDTDGTYYPPKCECDEQSGCCDKTTCYKPLNSECLQKDSGAKGQCNSSHVCAIAPMITVTAKTTNPQRVYTFEVNYCPPAQEKVIDFSYDVEWDIRHDTPNTLNLDCKTEVEISAELINPLTGEKYTSPLLRGLCPRPNEGGECKVGMTVSQGSSPPPQEIHCQYIPRHDMNVNTEAGVKEKATQ